MVRTRDTGGERTTVDVVPAPVLPFIVRPMRVRDIPAVMVIERCSFPAPWPESAYRYELSRRADSYFYVLQPRRANSPAWWNRLLGKLPRWGESPVLGYVGFRLRDDEAHICTIAVHPDWRGWRLGEFLLLLALEEMQRHSVYRATLEVRSSNRVAYRLYATVGFVRTEIRRAYYRDGEDAWLMVLGPLDEVGIARLHALRRAVEARLMESYHLNK